MGIIIADIRKVCKITQPIARKVTEYGVRITQSGETATRQYSDAQENGAAVAAKEEGSPGILIR